MALQSSLPGSNPSHDRAFRQLNGPGASNALAQISAAQLLPRGIHSLYSQNPGALLGSGQAAGMALGSHTYNSLPSGLNSSSGPMGVGAARYLAGLGMSTVLSSLCCSSPVNSTVAVCTCSAGRSRHEHNTVITMLSSSSQQHFACMCQSLCSRNRHTGKHSSNCTLSMLQYALLSQPVQVVASQQAWFK